MKFNESQLVALEASTPPTAEVQALTRAYLATAQISLQELSHRVGYHFASLGAFMNGRYIANGNAQTDVRVRRALVDFMAANPIQVSTELNGRLHETGNVQVMRHWFERCLKHRDIAFVYGAPGSQKTFVFEHLIADHNRREISKNGHGTRAYYVYCSESITPVSLLRKMARAAAIPSAGTVLGLMDNLRHHLHGRRSIFVLDEAQHLGIKTLEVVRELNDCEPHAAILLAGSHRLLHIFKDRAAELEQWNSRITKGVELPGITGPEAVGIVEAEMPGVSPAQSRQIIEASRVVDGYSKAKEKYISARRLFRQIHDITSDPRWNAATQKEHAA